MTPIAVKRLERWTWILIYVGMAVAAIGTALIANGHPATGWSFAGVGGGGIAIGAVLILVRARMPPDPTRPPLENHP